jgi:DNA helicase-2/ATP-dependent DNA helicase PcrA
MWRFGILKKSYRNTVEISEFATEILRHGNFSIYPAEPILRHGNPVSVTAYDTEDRMNEAAITVIKNWQKEGHGTIAVICADGQEAEYVTKMLEKKMTVADSNPETAVFNEGVMVLPVEYTKGLEFDAVLIYDPTRADYPTDDGHAKLLYVAATRALHELCVLYHGDLTGLIADPIPEKKTTPSVTVDDQVRTPETEKTIVGETERAGEFRRKERSSEPDELEKWDILKRKQRVNTIWRIL